jgi:endoglucanase
MRLRFAPVSLPGFLLALLLIPAALQAVAQNDALALRRAPALARGINLSSWFASSSDLSAAHIAKQVTPVDLKLIHDLGFTYVRIGFDPTQFMANGGFDSADSRAALARMDEAIHEAFSNHLAVSLCLFPNDDYKRQLQGQAGADQFLFLWRMLAQHYAATDADHLFFELINEPELNDPYRWDGLQAAAVSVIRGVDLAHTIIATGSFYSGLPELLKLDPVRDGNVIYNFHFYEPMPFTHQGATWGSFEWNYYKDIPYPASPEALGAALAGVPDESARYTLYLYGAAGWNRSSMLGRLMFARQWADSHHVPIICDEFGAYRSTVPNDSRARYLRDVRSDLEQLHIGWSMWEYNGGFGLVTRTPDGFAIPDAATVDALGLRMPGR